MSEPGRHLGRTSLEEIWRKGFGSLVTGGAVKLETALRRVVGGHLGSGRLRLRSNGGNFQSWWRQVTGCLATRRTPAGTQFAEQGCEQLLTRKGRRSEQSHRLRSFAKAVDRPPHERKILPHRDVHLATGAIATAPKLDRANGVAFSGASREAIHQRNEICHDRVHPARGAQFDCSQCRTTGQDESCQLTAERFPPLPFNCASKLGSIASAAAQRGARHDRARINAPVSDASHFFHIRGKKYGPYAPGNLRDSIYQVFSKTNSYKDVSTYHISWNADKAPYGAMVEFGTSKAPARSFIGKAVTETRTQVRQAIKERYLQEVGHGS